MSPAEQRLRDRQAAWEVTYGITTSQFRERIRRQEQPLTADALAWLLVSCTLDRLSERKESTDSSSVSACRRRPPAGGRRLYSVSD